MMSVKRQQVYIAENNTYVTHGNRVVELVPTSSLCTYSVFGTGRVLCMLPKETVNRQPLIYSLVPPTGYARVMAAQSLWE